MINDTKYLDIITNYYVDNEHYPATFLAIQGLLNEVEYRQAAYVNWTLGKSYTFTDLRNQKQLRPLIEAIQKDQYLFGRKFARNCYIAPLDNYLIYRTFKN